MTMACYLLQSLKMLLKDTVLTTGEKESRLLRIKPSAHSRFLSLRHAIFVFSLKNLLCAVT